MWRTKWEMGCVKCGYDENPAALEWDHVEPICQTASQRDRNYRINYQALKRHIEDPNVQVLCANCHAIKTVAENLNRAKAQKGDLNYGVS